MRVKERHTTIAARLGRFTRNQSVAHEPVVTFTKVDAQIASAQRRVISSVNRYHQNSLLFRSPTHRPIQKQ